ncbi:MerR family transcriptional regulator [Streptomyces sp. NPDC021356]|uniref:DNA polymerase III subunit beta family protein n=1 Tax=Streptomyces sp. NPDC021356 TaxID=3154900 RepID=UPI0034025B07
MENDMYSIGEMARTSGLSVSALRFYDRAGVLVPAWVDPVSGYRWYAAEQYAEAAVLARLRRAGMPLADIRLVLAGWSSADTDLVRGLLQTHLRRLEAGLSDARSEFSALRTRLDHRENPMTSPRTTTARLAVPAPDLAAALDAVRFAAGTDPELPMLSGVLFDIEGATLRVVATDRYRMAVAQARTTGHEGPRTQVIAPLPLVDAMRALLGGDEPAHLAVDAGRLTLETGDRQTAGQCLEHDFPDYRRLVDLPAGRRAVVDVADFRKALETGPVHASEVREQDGVTYDLSVLGMTDDGKVTLCEDTDDAHDRIAFNREFLLHALTAGARDELLLEFSAPTAPLVIRRPDDEDTFSLLMPVRLDD